MADILARIVEHKRTEIPGLHARAGSEDWEGKARRLPAAADFLAPLARGPGIAVIAEIKKASPAAGTIRPDFDPIAIAQSYARHGAACLSILTDERFFQGSIEHLRAVAAAVRLPLLRKDFILDPVQVFEAKLAGASAVLLIAECLSAPRLAELVGLVQELGMTPLVELYDRQNLPSVLASGARLIGINNRDLRTFTTDIHHTLAMLEAIPGDRLVVSESGIKSAGDLRQLEQAGVRAVLIGEAFLRAADPGRLLADFLDGRSTVEP